MSVYIFQGNFGDGDEAVTKDYKIIEVSSLVHPT